VKFTGAILCPLAKILLVNSTGQMEMRLIAAPQNSCGRDVLKNILRKSFMGFPVCYIYFLCNHLFVLVHSEICVKNSSQFDQKSPRQQRVFERNASDSSIDARTRCIFSGVLTFRRRPLGFLGNADQLALTFETHRTIVFRSGTESVAYILKRVRNALCVAVTKSLFSKNASITKPRCSPDQLMVSNDN